MPRTKSRIRRNIKKKKILGGKNTNQDRFPKDQLMIFGMTFDNAPILLGSESDEFFIGFEVELNHSWMSQITTCDFIYKRMIDFFAKT